MRRVWPLWVAALWWGSLTSVGFWVVPLLFKHLPTPAMAGSMAAVLFSAQTWVALVCGLLLLFAARQGLVPTGEFADVSSLAEDAHSFQPADMAQSCKDALVFIALGMLLAALSEFAVAPRIIARENLRLWHAVGTGLYVVQWLCAGMTLWRLSKPR